MNRHNKPGPELAYQNAGLSTLAPPELDVAEYAEDMAQFDISEDRKREFLETMWSISRMLAEMGIKHDVCGQLFGEFNQAAGESDDGVELRGYFNTEKTAGKESPP